MVGRGEEKDKLFVCKRSERKMQSLGSKKIHHLSTRIFFFFLLNMCCRLSHQFLDLGMSCHYTATELAQLGER